MLSSGSMTVPLEENNFKDFGPKILGEGGLVIMESTKYEGARGVIESANAKSPGIKWR